MIEDFIKREDAIEAINKALDRETLLYGLVRKIAIDAIIQAPSADRPQGDVDAVAILMREMHNLDQGYITIGEFDERIEPLRHLCYGRPQGEWILDRYNSQGVNRCSECGAEIKGYGENIPFPNCPYCLAKMKRSRR